MKMGMLAAISMAYAGLMNKGTRIFNPLQDGAAHFRGKNKSRRVVYGGNNKFTPHQSLREKTRRLRQAAEGKCHNMPICTKESLQDVAILANRIKERDFASIDQIAPPITAGDVRAVLGAYEELLKNPRQLTGLTPR